MTDPSSPTATDPTVGQQLAWAVTAWLVGIGASAFLGAGLVGLAAATGLPEDVFGGLGTAVLGGLVAYVASRPGPPPWVPLLVGAAFAPLSLALLSLTVAPFTAAAFVRQTLFGAMGALTQVVLAERRRRLRRSR